MAKFCKKPVIVDAEQYLPGEQRTLPRGVREQTVPGRDPRPYVVTAHNQEVYLEPGDWVIEERDGRGFYPCKPDIFADTYRPAE